MSIVSMIRTTYIHLSCNIHSRGSAHVSCCYHKIVIYIDKNTLCNKEKVTVSVMVFNATFDQIFQAYRWWRKTEYSEKTTDLSQVYNIMLYRVHHTWAGFELTTLVVMGTDCRCTCILNSPTHTITTTTALEGKEFKYIYINIAPKLKQK